MPNVNYNGKVLNFPDGTPQTEMEDALKQLDQQNTPAAQPAPMEHPIPTSQPIHFPDDIPAQQARDALAIATKANVAPTYAVEHKKELEDGFTRQALIGQLDGLPKLKSWMERSGVNAAAASDDVDNLGVVDYFFGHGHQVPFAGNTPEEIAANKAGQGRYVEDTPPGWWLNFGRWSYNMASSFQDFFEEHYGTPDVERMRREQEIGQTKLPGEDAPVGKFLYGAQDLVQGVAPYALNAPLAYGMMYVQGDAQVYRSLRMAGWEHEESENISTLAGFTSASIGAAMGGRLFGSFLPKGMLTAAQSSVSNSILREVSSNPGVWSFLTRSFKNQAYALAMNASMAATNSAIVRGADAYKNGTSFPYSKMADDVTAAVKGSFALAPLSLYAAGRSVVEQRALYEWGAPLREANAVQNRDEKQEMEIFDKFEQAGTALRSLHEAGDLSSAAEAVQNSKFYKQHPREAQLMIKSFIDPFKGGSVYVNPETLLKLDPEERTALGIKNFEEALSSGMPAEVPMEKFLTTPSATSLLKDSSRSLDSMTPKEAQANLKDWGEWANTEQPSPDQRKPKKPDVELGFKGTLTRDRLNWWAADQVKDRPTGQYEDLLKLHKLNEGAARREKEAQEQIASEALARSTGKAQKGVEAGTVSAEEKNLPPLWSQETLAGDRLGSRKALNRAEDRGTAAVSEEVKAGDAKLKAAKMERVEGINAAMGRKLRDAKEQADKLTVKIEAHGTADARAELYAAGPEYGRAVDAILGAIHPAEDGHGQVAVDLREVKQKINNDGGISTFDPEALNKLLDHPKGVGGMTLEGVTNLEEALRQIHENAKAQNDMRFNGKAEAKEEFLQGVRDYLKNIKTPPRGQNSYNYDPNALTTWETLKAWFSGVKASFNQPRTIFEKMGPGGDKLWYGNFVPALIREERLHQEILPLLKEASERMPKEVADTANDPIPPPPGAPASMGHMVRSGVWRLMAHLGNESGLLKISDGFGIDPQTLVSWTQANLGRTPEHATHVMDHAVQPAWDAFEKLWDQYEAQDFNGRPPPTKLKRSTMTINGKEYSGGYGGYLRSHAQDAVVYDKAPKESMAELLGLDAAYPATQDAQLKERDTKGVVPDLSWAGLPASMSREIHDLAFYDFVRNAKEMLSDGDVRKTLSDTIGRHYVEQLFKPGDESSWLYTLARGRVSDLSEARYLMKGFYNIQGRAAMTAFTGNVRVMAMQFSHIPAVAFGEGLGLGPLPVAGEAANMLNAVSRAFDPDRRAWAHTVADVLGFRENDFARHNMEMIHQLTGVQADNFATQLSWDMYQKIDSYLSHAVFEMGLNKALLDGMPQDQAIQMGIKAVHRGMPAQTIYEQSGIVRNRGFVGLSFLVRNFPNTLANMASLRMWDARVHASNPYQLAFNQTKAVSSYLAMVASAEIFGKWLGGSGPKQDEDPISWAARRAVIGIAYPTMGGDAVEYAYDKLSGDSRAASNAKDRMISPANSEYTRLIDDLGNAWRKEDHAAIKAALDALSIGTKVPINRVYDAVSAPFNSEDPMEALKKGAGY